MERWKMAKNDAELTISNDGLELLAKKFKFMAFLDEARWGNEHANYMLPNFYD